ncbi:16844_t:CDS:2 [Rhizophagus irregularis]|nr:16844_t:CDS:2 [Rhizophagus irregularis]
MSTYTDHIEVQIPPHIQDDKVHIYSHNEKPITMMTISLKSEYIVTYSKEDESFEGWSRNPSSESSGPFTLDDEYRELKNMDVLDFKVSDNKIIITKCVSVEEFIFDMKNKKKIILDIYEDDPEFEKEIEKLKEEFEELTLKISESLMVIKFGDIFYIYSNEMNVPIGKIIVKAYGLYQNKPLIIDMKKMFNNNSTNSKDSENNLIISIKDSEQDNKNQKENSKDSVQDNTNQNNLDDNIFYRIKNLLDKDEKQLLTDDGRKLFKNQYTGDENQYTNWISKRKNEKQLIKKRKQVIIDIKKRFMEKYVIPTLKDTEKQNKDIEKQDKNDNNTIEKQNNVEEYDLILIEKPSNKILGASGEAIEEIIIKVNEKISYNTKLSNNEYNNWILVNQKDKNTCILYNEYESELPELRIYIFNMEFKKIQLQHCYNIEFLTCAIKYYYNIKLDILEIEIIAKHTENGSLKVQWIDYLLNNEYDFLVHYGEILLKSAIKQKNIELMEKIIKKTLEYFKKDLKRNIYILSIIFNNVPYLESNYVENLLKYYNETTLFLDSSNQKYYVQL